MLSKDYFNCGKTERAAFEAGIKLASLYHTYMGSPLNLEIADHFEKVMENGMMTQPYVKHAEVRIDRDIIRSSVSSYGYCSLNERMLNAKIEVEYESVCVVAELGWIDELSYPLMRIIDIKGS
jgi:hypothetical protein